MKNVWMVLLILLGTMVWSQAQEPDRCSKAVYDEAGVLGPGHEQVEQAAQGVNARGAEMKVRTFATLNGQNLDQVEAVMEKSCPSWLAPNGVRKSTLIVLAVAPVEHKVGIYYGSAWHKALDDHWNRIKQEQMGPRFHDRDFAGGFVAAENALSARLLASQDEALHPVQSTTINQEAPTDYSGLWLFLKWCLGIFTFAGLLAWWYTAKQRRREEREDVGGAQAEACTYRNRCSRLVTGMTASGLSDDKKETYERLSDDYSNLAGSQKGDPEQNGLTKAEYVALAKQYREIWQGLVGLVDGTRRETPKSQPMTSSPQSQPYTPKKKHVPEPEPEPVRERAVDSFPSTTVIVAGNEFGSREPEREEPVEHESRHHSSWRDDSDSSSSSSSGGSSDFGSSSGSDWGGGGSSDFGGGGGGGGGSSDF